VVKIGWRQSRGGEEGTGGLGEGNVAVNACSVWVLSVGSAHPTSGSWKKIIPFKFVVFFRINLRSLIHYSLYCRLPRSLTLSNSFIMKINLPKKLSLLSFFSIILCSPIVGITQSAQAEEYLILDSCNNSGSAFTSSYSEQVSVSQRPYITAMKLYLSPGYSLTNLLAKSTCFISKENNLPRRFKFAIPDGSDLVKARVTLFTNGIRKGSKIISRGQVFNFALNPKFVDDYTIIYESVQGDGYLYWL
jgi:hypothetical protein